MLDLLERMLDVVRGTVFAPDRHIDVYGEPAELKRR